MTGRRGDSESVDVKIGGGLVKKLLPYLVSGGIGISVAGATGMMKQQTGPTPVEVANLQIQVAALQSDVLALKNTTEKTDGKVDTILTLMRKL